MIRIKEVLVFKTDEERLEWFHSLSPDEQAEVVNETKELADKAIEAFRPVAEVYTAWFSKFTESLSKIGVAFAMASQQCEHWTIGWRE